MRTAGVHGHHDLLSATDDTAIFIRDLESTANRVLRKANKKRIEKLIQEGIESKKKVKGATVLSSASFQLTATTGALRDVSLQPPKMSIRVGEPLSAPPPRTLSPLPSRQLAPSGGSWIGSRSTGSLEAFTESDHLGSTTGSKAAMGSTASSLTLGRTGEFSSSRRDLTLGGGRIHRKLAQSPFYSVNMESMSASLNQLTGSTGSLSDMRSLSPAKILGIGSHGPSRKALAQSKLKAGKPTTREIESQGVTSWSSDDLRVKYRSEEARQEAHEAQVLAEEAAKRLKQLGHIVPVAEVTPHPMHSALKERIEKEMVTCLLRAAARNKMRRFVLDIHQVWIRNLEHLQEYQGVGDEAPNDAARRGLPGARDVAAIRAGQSQIQSVRAESAFNKAVYHIHSESTQKHAPSSPEIPECTSPSAQLTMGDEQTVDNAVVHSLPPLFLPLLSEHIFKLAQHPQGHLKRQIRIGRFESSVTASPPQWRVVAYNPADGSEVAHQLLESAAITCAMGALHVPTRLRGCIYRIATRLRCLNVDGTSQRRVLTYLEFFARKGSGERVVLTVTAYPMNMRGKIGVRRHRILISVSDFVARSSHWQPSGGRNKWWMSGSADVRSYLISAAADIFAYAPEDMHGNLPLLLAPIRRSAGQDGSSVPWPIPVGTNPIQLIAARSLASTLTCVLDFESQGSTDLSLNIRGIESPELVQQSAGFMDWEQEAFDGLPALSLQVSGLEASLGQVPGSLLLEGPGPSTSVSCCPVAKCFRDPTYSSTASILVVVSEAIEAPQVLPTVLCHSDEAYSPDRAPHEPIRGPVPLLMSILYDGLRSGTEPGLIGVSCEPAPGIMALTSVADLKDYTFPDSIAERDALKRGVRHRRQRPDWGSGNARSFVLERLLVPIGALETLQFGVSQRATTGNATGVLGRSTYHSSQRCVEQLCRWRTAKDFADISANSLHVGLNDPGSYSVSMSHERFRKLWRMGLNDYEAEVRRIAEIREKEARDAALEAKIQAGRARIAERKRREEETQHRLALAREHRKLDVEPHQAGRRRRWEARLSASEVLHHEGDWELRQDTSGSQFYHCIDAYVPNPFSWDPPPGWIGLLGGAAGEIKDGSSEESPRLLSLAHTSSADDGASLAAESTAASTVALVKDTMQDTIGDLLQSEEVLQRLAWHLGIPANQVRPSSSEPALCRPTSPDPSERSGVDGQVELNSDDDIYSGSEDEAGYCDSMPPVGLPQDHADLRRAKLAARRERQQKDKLRKVGVNTPNDVPPLVIPEHPTAEQYSSTLEGHLYGVGWRHLGSEHLPKNFLEKAVNPHTLAAPPGVSNTLPSVHVVGMMETSTASKAPISFDTPLQALFIGDILAEQARLQMVAERKMADDAALHEDSSMSTAHMLEIGPQAITSVERAMIAAAERDTQPREEAQREDAERRAISSCKTGNMEDLEDALEEGISIDTRDINGNTLLLLACQQGNKRVAKFLLRRGATINAQNHDGNTCLHFCHSLRHVALAEYMASKGCDDKLLNSAGLTCYEGLRREAVDAL